MPSPQRSLFFLLTILLSLHLFPLTSTLALTLPPPPSPPTITILPTNLTRSPSSSSSPPLNSIFNCVRKSWFAPCPDYFDCARAILELPDYESVGSFHNGPPNDPFRLPLSKTEGTCRVRIELAHEGGSTQGGSWHIVVARSLSLAHMCVLVLSFRIISVPDFLFPEFLFFSLFFCCGEEGGKEGRVCKRRQSSFLPERTALPISHLNFHTIIFPLLFSPPLFSPSIFSKTTPAPKLTPTQRCFKEPLRANMGGWTALGNHERLLVILEYSGVRDAVGIGVGVGNVTII